MVLKFWYKNHKKKWYKNHKFGIKIIRKLVEK